MNASTKRPANLAPCASQINQTALSNLELVAFAPSTVEGWMGDGMYGKMKHEATTTYENGKVSMSEFELRLQTNVEVGAGAGEQSGPVEGTFIVAKMTQDIEGTAAPDVEILGTVTLVITSGKVSTSGRSDLATAAPDIKNC